VHLCNCLCKISQQYVFKKVAICAFLFVCYLPHGSWSGSVVGPAIESLRLERALRSSGPTITPCLRPLQTMALSVTSTLFLHTSTLGSPFHCLPSLKPSCKTKSHSLTAVVEIDCSRPQQTSSVIGTQTIAVSMQSSAFALVSFWMESLTSQRQTFRFSAVSWTSLPLFLYHP